MRDLAAGVGTALREKREQVLLDLDFPLEETARLVCEAALEALDCPFDAQVCLTITDSEAIHRMNREFRGIDSPTDVLSFPLTQLPAPGDFSELEAYADSLEQEAYSDDLEHEEFGRQDLDEQEESELQDKGKMTDGLASSQNEQDISASDDQHMGDLGDCFDSDTGELLLGDIVINLDRVFSQAQEYGHSTRREYAFLLAHSMLHLMGFDHMEAEEAKEMEARQESILEGLGIRRG